jgi:hypothetical protein
MITLLGMPPGQETQYEEATAEEFLDHGFSFLQSALVLNQNQEKLGPHRFAPIYNDIAHSYELLLKACLLHAGCTHKEITKSDIRHNLEALLVRAQEKGLKIPYEHEYEIYELNKYTKKHEFRYPCMGDKFVKDTDSLIHIGQQLHVQIVEFMRSRKKPAND